MNFKLPNSTYVPVCRFFRHISLSLIGVVLTLNVAQAELTTQSFENGIPQEWTTPPQADTAWVLSDVEVFDGRLSLQSTFSPRTTSNIKWNRSEDSVVQWFKYFLEGTIRFNLLTAGASTDSFSLFVDDILVIDRKSPNEWSEYQFDVTEGFHEIRFVYQLDVYKESESKTAWIDNIRYLDPDDIDSDGDGLADYWEDQFGLDRNIIDDINLDVDSDGLTSGEEFSAGSDPFNLDSDGDSLSDGDEVNQYGTSPTARDTDRDSLPDNWEISHDLDPNLDDAYEDLDGDGSSNYMEFVNETNPRDDTSFVPAEVGFLSLIRNNNGVPKIYKYQFEKKSATKSIYKASFQIDEKLDTRDLAMSRGGLIVGIGTRPYSIASYDSLKHRWEYFLSGGWFYNRLEIVGNNVLALSGLDGPTRFIHSTNIRTGKRKRKEIAHRLDDISIGLDGNLYGIVNFRDTHELIRIDPETLEPAAIIPFGGEQRQIVVDMHSDIFSINDDGFLRKYNIDATLVEELQISKRKLSDIIIGRDNSLLISDDVGNVFASDFKLLQKRKIENGIGVAKSLTYFRERSVSDSDQDGIPDFWELDYGLDPMVDDSATDYDEDDLSAIDEYSANTNPFQIDTDGDGLLDGEEINQTATNPVISDTDGDGIKDSWEVENGLNPLISDSEEDADEDNSSNYLEFLNGTDPNDNFSVALSPGTLQVISRRDISTYDDAREFLTSVVIPSASDSPYIETDSDSTNSELYLVEGGAFPTLKVFNQNSNIWQSFQYYEYQGESIRTHIPFLDLKENVIIGINDFAGGGLVVFNKKQKIFSRMLLPYHAESLSRGLDGYIYALGYIDNLHYKSVLRIHPDTYKLLNTIEVGSLSSANNVVSDREGNLFVSYISGVIYKFSAEGEYLTNIDTLPFGIVSMDIGNDSSIVIVNQSSTAFVTDTQLTEINSFLIQGQAIVDVKYVDRVVALDRDTDGMPDYWELDNDLDPGSRLDAALDQDEDGLSNVEEFELGSNPNTSDTDEDGLSDFVEVNITQTSIANPDTDDDGLNDGNEVNVHFTNPLNSDSDSDGVFDGTEISIGLNPKIKDDLNEDYDGDGFTNLEELAYGSQVGDRSSSPLFPQWTMRNGNSKQDRYVPYYVDPLLFNTRWEIDLETEMRPLVVGQSSIAISTNSENVEQRLIVLDARTGVEKWRKIFFGKQVHPPVIVGNTIFMQSNNSTRLHTWGFDSLLGKELFQTIENDRVGRPGTILHSVPYGSSLYVTNGGREISQVDIKTGDKLWTILGSVRGNLINGRSIYIHASFPSRGLNSFNRFTGHSQFSIQDDNFSDGGLDTSAFPIMGKKGDVITVTDNYLTLFDIENRKIKWQQSGEFGENYAVSDGSIYINNGGKLEVYSELSGLYGRTISTPALLNEVSNWIVTKAHLFVGLNDRTIAINLETDEVVWSNPNTGYLALNAVDALYIQSPHGKITAIDLGYQFGIDSDSDGVPNWWEQLHGLNINNPNDATNDNDGDSLSNEEEYILNTNPLDLDTDGDGLEDGLEVRRGISSPARQDSDSDGIPDGYELDRGMNPEERDNALDIDEDGLPNLAEYELFGSSPLTVGRSYISFENGLPKNWDASADGVSGWSVAQGGHYSELALEGKYISDSPLHSVTWTEDFVGGTISFWSRYESDGGDSAYIRVYVDGEPRLAERLLSSWGSTELNIDKGVHEIKWEFHGGRGNTSASIWIDNISFVDKSLDSDNDGLPNYWEHKFGFNPEQSGDELIDSDEDTLTNAQEFQLETNPLDRDSDNDQVSDAEDVFPLDNSESSDYDQDGIGDNEDLDDDNDGVNDFVDAFPENALETVDSDMDGIGDNSDLDDDNDGVDDLQDSFPLDFFESTDTDRDGEGDNLDADDDNDGVLDFYDDFPLDSTRTKVVNHHFVNIATRGYVGAGEEVLIGGLVISGSRPKMVLIRGIGPSLGVNGIENAIINPKLQLFSGATLISVNDDWEENENSKLIPARLIPDEKNESVIVAMLNPGAYTAILSGVGDTSGVGLIEVFELEESDETRLVNIATRGYVGTGENVLIGGIFISGSEPMPIVVRAKGPSLLNSGLTNILRNPKLTLYSGVSIVDSNDNWQDHRNSNDIPLSLRPTDPLEAAIYTTLEPGAYTIIVEGVDSTEGIGIVELFELTEQFELTPSNLPIPARDDYPYLMTAESRGLIHQGSNSPKGESVINCTVLVREEQGCTFSALPLIGMESSSPSINHIMSRVVTSHDWMRSRFREILIDLPTEILLMTRGITAIVISSDISPSFYYPYTGAIYLNPDWLWLTQSERNTISDVADSRSGFDSQLQFAALWRYVFGNTDLRSYPRNLEWNRIRISSLLLHELAHANDYFAPLMIGDIDIQLTPEHASTILESEKLTNRLPLSSILMKDLAEVTFFGNEATDEQREITPEDVADEFPRDIANDFYNYSTQREDIAMAFEEAMMFYAYGISRDVAFTNAPNSNSCRAYQVAWGERNRIAHPEIMARSVFAINSFLPEMATEIELKLTDIPNPTQMQVNLDWCSNINLSPPASRALSYETLIPVSNVENIIPYQ